MTSQRLVLLGWTGFTLSGVFYLISGLRAGDWFAVTGSVVWLAAVALFLVAVRRTG